MSLDWLLFRTVFQHLAPCYETRSLLAHLVKAEVVPSYGILINMDVGNPLGNKRALRPMRRRSIFIAFIKGYIPVFLPDAYLFPALSSSAQVSISFIATKPSSYVRIQPPR